MSKTNSSQNKSSQTKVNCPQCQKEVIWHSSSPFRPFCSNRCKMLDLGAWANEDHVIAGDEASDEHPMSLVD